MRSDALDPAQASVAVIGGGTMGEGIAYIFAIAGFRTHLVEPDAARREAVARTLTQVAGGAVARGRATAEDATARIGAIAMIGEIEALPDGVDLAIETVPERLELKRQVLSAIDARRPKLIATNTSALSVDDLAGAVSDPGAFLGMHFFNPVWSLKLVELIRGAATRPETVAAARAFAEAAGKTTIEVADAPGFATSRLDLIRALEAIRMVEAGVASPADIDRAMTTAYRHPVGPLRLTDLVGLDVRLDIARHLARELGPRHAPPPLLETMVQRGDLGRKSGRGFFDWSEDAA